MKKIIKILIKILLVLWIAFELINIGQYIEIKKSNFELYIPQQHKYRPVAVQLLYRAIPQIEDIFEPATNGCRDCTYKPVIYLYPTKTEQVKIKLDYKGKLIADYPAYDYSKKGWEVTAYPDGKIINSDGKEYSYLFWEGKPSIPTNYDLSTGFVVKGEDTVKFLQDTLSKMGLTPKEYNEFIVYWYPKMKNNNYNLIHFADKQYTDTTPLVITPTPDSVLRVFMVFKPLDKAVELKSQEIKPFNRTGFSVIEWGGTELGK